MQPRFLVLVLLLVGRAVCLEHDAPTEDGTGDSMQSLPLRLHAKLRDVGIASFQLQHQAFTDLMVYQDKLLVAFRAATSHRSYDGTIRIMSQSIDGDSVLSEASVSHWTMESEISVPKRDLRDPHLSITPRGALMLIMGSRSTTSNLRTAVAFSDDAVSWTAPRNVTDTGMWIWRATWSPKDSAAYGFAYDVTRKHPTQLVKSSDGLTWTKVMDLPPLSSKLNESHLVFHGDKAVVALRNAGEHLPSKDGGILIGRAVFPYTQWVWKNANVNARGPALLSIQYPGETSYRWLLAGRDWRYGSFRESKHQFVEHTGLWELDVETAETRLLSWLPTTGDNSYPGLVFDPATKRLMMSYYSTLGDEIDDCAVFVAMFDISA